MYRFLVRFSRFQSSCSDREESVWVVLETKYNDSDITINEWEQDAWNALFKQYPIWNCPFNQSNPVKTIFEELRYRWSSPFLEESIKL